MTIQERLKLFLYKQLQNKQIEFLYCQKTIIIVAISIDQKKKKSNIPQNQQKVIHNQSKSISLNHNQDMQSSANQLYILYLNLCRCNIFDDTNYAWQLLNAQINIQMSLVASGQTIAYLLQLYMYQRGVQKMNSLGDSRQSYFKNKVTTLMTKQTVIKSLKENPMKKKSKPDQVQTSNEKNEKSQKGQKSTKNKKANKKSQKKQSEKPVTTNALELQQKRKQLQMRMAYVAAQNGPQSLKKIIAQQDHRQQNISNKINKIMNSHQQRLNERIKARRLKTSTFRTRSEINMQQTQSQPLDTIQGQNNLMNEGLGQKKQQQGDFSPFKKLLIESHKFPKKQQIQRQQLRNKLRKKYKSLQVQPGPRDDSPDKKARKYTHDNINPKKSFS